MNNNLQVIINEFIARKIQYIQKYKEKLTCLGCSAVTKKVFLPPDGVFCHS